MPHFCLAVIERCQTAPSPVRLKYLQLGREGVFVTQTAQKWKARSARREQRTFPPEVKQRGHSYRPKKAGSDFILAQPQMV